MCTQHITRQVCKTSACANKSGETVYTPDYCDKSRSHSQSARKSCGILLRHTRSAKRVAYCSTCKAKHASAAKKALEVKKVAEARKALDAKKAAGAKKAPVAKRASEVPKVAETSRMTQGVRTIEPGKVSLAIRVTQANKITEVWKVMETRRLPEGGSWSSVPASFGALGWLEQGSTAKPRASRKTSASK